MGFKVLYKLLTLTCSQQAYTGVVKQVMVFALIQTLYPIYIFHFHLPFLYIYHKNNPLPSSKYCLKLIFSIISALP